MTRLRTAAGAGWGYFIFIVFLANMLADIQLLVVTAIFRTHATQTLGAHTAAARACPELDHGKRRSPQLADTH